MSLWSNMTHKEDDIVSISSRNLTRWIRKGTASIDKQILELRQELTELEAFRNALNNAVLVIDGEPMETISVTKARETRRPKRPPLENGNMRVLQLVRSAGKALTAREVTEVFSEADAGVTVDNANINRIYQTLIRLEKKKLVRRRDKGGIAVWRHIPGALLESER